MAETKVPKLLTLRDVAAQTGLPRWRLYQMIAAGEAPPHLRIGKTIRISEFALVQWIEEQHSKGAVRP
jgi:excisionase family DNA binding protein